MDSFRLLANDPSMFSNSQNIVWAEMPVIPGYLKGRRSPTRLDNQGLHLSLPLMYGDHRILAILGCTVADKADHRLVELSDISANGGRFIRIEWQRLESVPPKMILSKARFKQVSCEMEMPYRAMKSSGPAKERIKDDFGATATSHGGGRFRRLFCLDYLFCIKSLSSGASRIPVAARVIETPAIAPRQIGRQVRMTRGSTGLPRRPLY